MPLSISALWTARDRDHLVEIGERRGIVGLRESVRLLELRHRASHVARVGGHLSEGDVPFDDLRRM